MLWIAVLLVGTYGLARLVRLDVEAAVFAAATFGFSGAVLAGVGVLELPAPATVREAGIGEYLVAPDLVSLGFIVVLVGLIRAFRGTEEIARDDVPTGWLPGALGLGLATAGVVLVLRARGFPGRAAAALQPDLHGSLDPLPWLAFPGLAFALVALLRGWGKVRRRTWFGPALWFAGVTVTTSTLGDTLPWSELGPWALAVGALLTALLAGDGLQLSSRAARTGAACVLLPIVVASFFADGFPPLAPTVATEAETDELVGFARLPRLDGGERQARLEGWIHPGLAVGSVVLRVAPVGTDGRALDVPREQQLELTTGALTTGAPPDARLFEGVVPGAEGLAQGRYRVWIDLLDGEGELLGSRRVGVFALERRLRLLPTIMALTATLALLVAPWSARWSPRVAIGLVVLQVLLVASAAG